MRTGIETKTKFFPLAWILFFCVPRIVINGETHKKEWGRDFFELEPGEYTVKIYFPYLWWSECGANEVSLTLAEGQRKKATFSAPFILTMKGNINVIEQND